MSFRLEGPVLEGTLVRLEPLAHRHAADLAVAAEQDRSSYGFTWVPRAAEVDDYINAQLGRAASGRMAPYAQVRISSGRAVGATAYWDPRRWPGRSELYAIEVGFTWLAGSVQGAGINQEAKLLLFRHAFEQWGVVRVGLKTDARNMQSRGAIEALGARFGRPAQLVSVVGTGGRGPAAGLGDVLGHCVGVAGMSASTGGQAGGEDWYRWLVRVRRTTHARGASSRVGAGEPECD
jgi:RimJ/RimL family protein N-acetyltransferase